MKKGIELLIAMVLACSANAQQAIPTPVPTQPTVPTAAPPNEAWSFPPPITAALISCAVVLLSRWVFSRNDRRFPILVQIQTKLLDEMADPPSHANGGGVRFNYIPELANRLSPFFDQLYLVSCPWRDCCVQKAFKKFSEIREEQWKREHPNHGLSDFFTSKEFLAEVKLVLVSLRKG